MFTAGLKLRVEWRDPRWFLPLRLAVLSMTLTERSLVAWFGIRGIGFIYYLMYATDHGLPDVFASILVAITVVTIAASIILHGFSATPLMTWYEERGRAGSRPRP